MNSDESFVLNKIPCFINGQLFLAFALVTQILIMAGQVITSSRTIRISEIKNYSIDEKRDIYSTFDSEDQIDQGLPIDPFDLMNRLKQAGAMDDATTPSDALDEALNSFNQSEYEIDQNE
tara:strand:+ start:684 stop:1043 length:360 start_codon:yes stop_codon:yes gene_type:complete